MDVVVGGSDRDLFRLLRLLERAGFELDPAEAKLMIEKGNRFVCYLDPCRVDFWLAKTPRERAEVKRARMVRVFDMRVRLLAPEDVILHKLASGRGRDLDDALGIPVRQKGKLNMSYLRSRTSALWPKRALARLLKQAEREGGERFSVIRGTG